MDLLYYTLWLHPQLRIKPLQCLYNTVTPSISSLRSIINHALNIVKNMCEAIDT